MIQFKTAMKLLRKNTSQNVFYFISAFVTSCLVFVLCNMLNNTFYNTLSMEWVEFYVPNSVSVGNFSTFNFLLFVALCYSLVMNYYTSQVFSNNYRKSITTLLLIGFSVSAGANVLLFQYLILTIPAILLSFFVSKISFIPMMDKLVYGLFNVTDAPIGVIYEGTYIIYWALVLSIVTLFILVQKGQISALTVTDLLHKRIRTNTGFKSQIIEKVVAKNYPLVYCVGMALFIFNWRDIAIIPCLLVGIYACFGILNFTIPTDCKSIKAKKPTVENYLILSGYVTDLKESFLSCTMLMVSVVVSVVLICQTNTTEFSCVMSVITLAAIVIMVCVSIFSQLFMGIDERVETAYRQYVLGVHRERILAINLKEIFLFFLTLIVVPGVYSAAIIIPSIWRGNLKEMYGIIYLLLMIIPLILCMILTMIVFNGRVRRKLWKS